MVMTTTLTKDQLYVTGRVQVPDPQGQQVNVAAQVDFSSQASYLLDFTLINQQQQIGTIRSMFADNTKNPSELVVKVSETNQRFTVPPFGEGYFVISATANSKIEVDSDGGATALVSLNFFNYVNPTSVWYQYGNAPNANEVQGTNVNGTDLGLAINTNPVLIAGATSAHIMERLLVEADGTLHTTNTGTQHVDIPSMTKLNPLNVNTGPDYETVAASQTDQILGVTGAVGDILVGLLIIPATTSPGAVSIKDGNGSAITVFTGGATSVSNLVPFFVPLSGIKALNATTPGWKVTTGANVSVIGVGAFT